MISLSNVTKIYRTRQGKRCVLDDVSFTIERGQSIGLMGSNGSGKTTLTRLIGGVEHPTSGVIRRGMSVSWPLGFAGGFQGSLSGADNARFIARIYGVPVDELVAFVEEFAELGEYLRMPFKTYSSGMRARLAFGVSLAIKFDCYLVDEVTGVGDGRFRERSERALAERGRDGALLLISHEIATLKRHCTTGAVLHRGKLTFYDSIDETVYQYGELMKAAS